MTSKRMYEEREPGVPDSDALRLFMNTQRVDECGAQQRTAVAKTSSTSGSSLQRMVQKYL